MSGPLFIDTCIPMYAGGRESPLREPCRRVLELVAGGEVVGVIDTEVLQEILHRFGRMGEFSTGADMAAQLMIIVAEVLPVTMEDMRLSITLFLNYGPKGLKARDSVHCAVMLNNGIERIVSVDKHFDLVPGIERVDPRELWGK